MISFTALDFSASPKVYEYDIAEARNRVPDVFLQVQVSGLGLRLARIDLLWIRLVADVGGRLHP